jgi:multiple sugar transport system permease protein
MDLLLKSNINVFGLHDFLLANRSFLGVPGLSLAVVIAAMVWVGVPFFGIMLLAALQSIPGELYEAVDIDGANIWQRFFSVTVPSIKPTIIMTILLRVIWVFNSSELTYIITGGGPGNSSQTLTSLLYMTANKTLDFGMTAALGLAFMVLLIGFAMFFIRATRYEEAGDY